MLHSPAQPSLLDVFVCRLLPLPLRNTKVCVVTVIGKSRYDRHHSKGHFLNSFIDSDIFLVCLDDIDDFIVMLGACFV